MAQSEASMEKALITQLTQDISQWTYRKDIVDEDSQAFSRTNRLFDKSKRYGMIVIFQRSAQFQTAVDAALLLYSNGGTKEVSAPSFDEIEQEFKSLFFYAVIRREMPHCAGLAESTSEFSKSLKVE